MGRPADDSCRHCGVDLWKLYDDKRGWEWRSFVGINPPSRKDPKPIVTSRFCREAPRGARVQHAPIPTRPEKLERWLDR
jgi:hypothetical protein